MQEASRLRIGLTGGIGSGKSTVARCLQELGAAVIDTDAIARSLTAPQGAAMPAIAAQFGAQAVAPDGALNRDWMRGQVFAKPEIKQQLERILHPMIGAETEAQAAAASTANPHTLLVFDVPLLVESGRWRQRVDRVLVVDCEEETQIQRVIQRNGWPREAVLAVLSQQASRQARRACADGVIFNEQLDLTALQAQVSSLFRRWT